MPLYYDLKMKNGSISRRTCPCWPHPGPQFPAGLETASGPDRK